MLRKSRITPRRCGGKPRARESSSDQFRDGLFERTSVLSGVDLDGMKVDARLFLGAQPINRSFDTADVSQLAHHPGGDCLSSRFCAASVPCLLDLVHLVAEAEARQL